MSVAQFVYFSTLWSVFRENSDEDHHLHFSKLRGACNALDLFPSTSQGKNELHRTIQHTMHNSEDIIDILTL